jgi:predicted RNase H-like nuclease (RuvC/YqgF family)
MKMTDEMKKQIQQLKTENEDMIATMLAMRREIKTIRRAVDDIHEEHGKVFMVARAVCELQDELRKTDLDIDIVNTVYAPMRVDGR